MLRCPMQASVRLRGKDSDTPFSLGNHRECMVDWHLWERSVGLRLAPHEPRDEGVALALDRPWEGPFSNYGTVLIGPDGLYRLYYRGLPVPKHDTGDESLCVALSRDGVHWTRPVIGRVKVRGSVKNNVLIGGSASGTHAFGVMLDPRPGVPAGERWKGLGVERTKDGKDWALGGLVSGDGLNWVRIQADPVIVNDTGHFAFDSQNLPLWSEAEGRFVAYGRTWKDGKRRVSRWESTDFRHWSGSTLMEYRSADGSPAQVEEMYINQTSPYFRAPRLLLATAARFFAGRQVLTDAQAKAIQVDPGYFKDTSDCVLLTSRGGAVYDRALPGALIKPGIGARNWVSRSNYPACGVVPTGPDRMSVYVFQDYGQPTAHVHRWSWRTDGFASLTADTTGDAVSRLLTFRGSRLEVNAATSAAGWLRFELLDESDRPIAGFTLDDCPEVIGNELARTVAWRSGADLRALAGRAVRLRVAMADADLYSLRFVG
jgi:hypothetical protein